MSSAPYVQIVREAIQNHFDKCAINKYTYLNQYPSLGVNKATFVTLTLQGKLRGCIGSLIAHRPLVDDLISNAQSAAFRDPRFSPLTREEFQNVTIEVSLLSEPVLCDYKDKNDLKNRIQPYKDGIILCLNDAQATFLPQVWEELPDFETFFAHLGMKAGIGSDPLEYHPEIYTYQVEKIKEE